MVQGSATPRQPPFRLSIIQPKGFPAATFFLAQPKVRARSHAAREMQDARCKLLVTKLALDFERARVDRVSATVAENKQRAFAAAARARVGRTKKRNERDEAIRPEVERLIRMRGWSDSEIAAKLTAQAEAPGGYGEKVTRERVGRVRRSLGFSPADVRRIRADIDLA